MKKNIALLLCLLGLISAACSLSVSPPTPTTVPTFTLVPTPTKLAVPDIFQKQILSFLEKGSRLTAGTGQGITYRDFGDQLAEVKGAYNLALDTWPEKFAPEAKAKIDHAIMGWDHALDLWDMKINDYDMPVEPNVNHYKEIVDYGGSKLVIDVHPNDYLVSDYRGKKFLPFDDNISVLLALAHDSFSAGKEELLKALQ